MNKATLVLAGTALALGAAVPSLLGGYLWGAATMETVVATPPVCTVEDQKLAEYHRATEIGKNLEDLIEEKARLTQENSILRSSNTSMMSLNTQLKLERVFLERTVAELRGQ